MAEQLAANAVGTPPVAPQLAARRTAAHAPSPLSDTADALDGVVFFRGAIDPETGEIRLPSHPAWASAARSLVRTVLANWDLAHLGDTAAQLVGELFANAVQHTGSGYLRLCVKRRGGWVRVEVRDQSRELPCLIEPGPEDLHGRGLLLVDALSQRWGADVQLRGKGVWAELRAPEASD